MKKTIQGLQRAQRDNLKLIASLKPGSAFENAIRIGTVAAHRYSVAQTHVDTGTLRASHRIKMEHGFSGPRGRVFIDPSVRNPRSRTLASQYGKVEHARGGEHAFYHISVYRHGASIARQVSAAYISRLPR